MAGVTAAGVLVMAGVLMVVGEFLFMEDFITHIIIMVTAMETTYRIIEEEETQITWLEEATLEIGQIATLPEGTLTHAQK
jgi:hypothetical protein